MTDMSAFPGILELCWKYFVLGALQGCTEFLPISSTAHLRAFPMFVGWDDPGVAVTAVLQLGSILAVIAYFKRDLQRVVRGVSLAFRNGQWQEPEAKLGISILLGTFPIVFFGGAIKIFWNGYEDSIFRSLPSIGGVSILMALLLAFAEQYGSRTKVLKEVRGIDGFLVGLAQVFALIPGVSRSGVTLTTALMNGWKRSDAARFSFLLGIPAITIAGLVELKEVVVGANPLDLLPLLIGISSAAVISWLSIDWFLKYLQNHGTWFFVIYRLIFGITLLAFWSGS